MKLFTALVFACGLMAQDPGSYVPFKATTGDVSLSAAGTTATLQVKTVNNVQIILDYVTVYCSVACTFTQTANGTAATTTAGTVTSLLPNPLGAALPVNFFTASNVGNGTDQAGIIHVGAGETKTIALGPPVMPKNITLGPSPGGPGTGTNYNIVVASITGTANVTFFGRIGN